MADDDQGLKSLLQLPWMLLYCAREFLAWGRDDWTALESLITRRRANGYALNSDHILLGLALSHQERLAEAIERFERVELDGLWQIEEVILFPEYASALSRIGQRHKAEALLQRARLQRWPLRRRRWAESFLSGCRESAPTSSEPSPTSDD